MISGACIAVRRNVFEQVGEFSSEYFMYGEDVDLCKRSGYPAGKSIICQRQALSTLAVRAQSCGNRATSQQSVYRNRCKPTSQNSTEAYSIAYRLSRVFMALLRTIVLISFTVLGGNPETKRARSASLRKWWTVFCWSIGIKTREQRSRLEFRTNRTKPQSL
jgi:hypothetical protein